MKVRITVDCIPDGADVTRAEFAAALESLREDYEAPGLTKEASGMEQSNAIGGFAHVGSITEQGRVSYTKFTAVFSAARYPGSNCGISILGA